MAERVFLLPDLGEGLEDAVVTEWLVNEGDLVELNQPFAEIETAKATVEVPSPFVGRVTKLHAVAGETVAVGAPLATFEVGAADVLETAGDRVAATPAVRRLAKDLGLDLATVPGTGPEGRVTREDLERTARPTVGTADDADVVAISAVRRAIARNLEAAATIPQVTTFRTVDARALETVRVELEVSPLPVFVRALVEIVPGHPHLNASWHEDGIRVHRAVHVGIAVDTERGLVVPVVHDANAHGIGAIAAEIGRLAESARDGSISPSETHGATISVSNTGSYGSEFGTPLLNPPGAVTIALGVIAPRPLVVDGTVEIHPACTLSCTFDHRVLDGAEVGRALTDLVSLLEDAERLRALPP
jgi:2-oxoisovalerate dehydrogenase E2 component (dihydrolipoyl transacylase)